MKRTMVLCAVLALLTPVFSSRADGQTPSSRIVVHDEAQLPRFSYPVTMAPSALLVADDATFAPFATAVGKDVDNTLRDYDIQDRASLRDFVQTKLAIQLLAHDNEGARATLATLRSDQSKPELKLLTGRLTLVKLDADAQAQAHPGTQAEQYVADLDRASVSDLPWNVVQDAIKQNFAFESTTTKDSIVGYIKHELDPIAAKSGTLDGPSARLLVEARSQIMFALPLFAADVTVLKAYIAQHNVVKPDIWAKRDVTLKASQIKKPVVIGIWDSGVDPSDYPDQMYVDAHGRHGIAFSDQGYPSSSYLYVLPASTQAKYPTLVKLFSGISDLQSATDSPDAEAVMKYLRSLSVDQAAAFQRNADLITEYAHGSHVAGIALRGNPGGRVAVARFDDDLPTLPFAPTLAWTDRMSADFAATGAYFRANHVRVVNMSWGDQVSEFEQWIAKTDKISDADARKAKAQQLFAIWRKAIENVIATNPQTLFVAAAGNADANATFVQDVPASLKNPNLLVVGATNQAGDATGFTSYGPTVAVFADGFHVPSKLPGGYVVKFSGTSMASPNVTNLAAKLFALDPSLTPTQVRALIVKGATLSPDGKRKLMDEKRSVQLLAAMKRAR